MKYILTVVLALSVAACSQEKVEHETSPTHASSVNVPAVSSLPSGAEATQTVESKAVTSEPVVEEVQSTQVSEKPVMNPKAEEKIAEMNQVDQLATADKAAADTTAAAKAAADKTAAAKAAAEKTAADKTAAAKAAADKAAADKTAADKTAADKTAAAKAAADKAAADKAAADKAAADKAAAAKTAADNPVAKVVAPLTQGKGPIRSEPKSAPDGAMLKERLGDAVAGAKVSKKCKSCHTFDQGGKKKTGPNLFGIVGREKGSIAGFKYGSYLASIGGVWDETSLKSWLADSKGVAKAAGKKSKMPAQKITGTKADDLIAYLKTLK